MRLLFDLRTMEQDASIVSNKTNVLLVCTDHWAGSLLGSAGHPAILTPTLDMLARNGTRFPNAYAEAPVCVPARRCIMTGLSPQGQGANTNTNLPMPDVTTMAQAFRNHGYQATAVGKLHVNPQRSRIGFDEVILDEEGRVHGSGSADDYELFLADRGYPGQRFSSGMANNEYLWRPWNLPEETHVTNWAAQQMSRTIKRRDPEKPAFWYLSFSHPHPPLCPLQAYLDIYRDSDIPEPARGDWSEDTDSLPSVIKARITKHEPTPDHQVAAVRRAFYALCTHIDHQLRVVLGTLREEGLANNTVILFTSDHGDMLGDHHMWAKCQMYQGANCVPMILTGANGDQRVASGHVDNRFVGHADIMPTLLDLAGLPIPDHVEGISMVGEKQREYMLSECGDSYVGTRMVRKGDFKLIYHAGGNLRQLFNLANDPQETRNLANEPEHTALIEELTAVMVDNLWGAGREWIRDGKLVGLPEIPFTRGANRSFSGQRGIQFP